MTIIDHIASIETERNIDSSDISILLGKEPISGMEVLRKLRDVNSGEVCYLVRLHPRRCTCLRCGYVWDSRVASPKRCPSPRCKSPYWSRPRRIALTSCP